MVNNAWFFVCRRRAAVRGQHQFSWWFSLLLCELIFFDRTPSGDVLDYHVKSLHIYSGFCYSVLQQRTADVRSRDSMPILWGGVIQLGRSAVGDVLRWQESQNQIKGDGGLS